MGETTNSVSSRAQFVLLTLFFSFAACGDLDEVEVADLEAPSVEMSELPAPEPEQSATGDSLERQTENEPAPEGLKGQYCTEKAMRLAHYQGDKMCPHCSSWLVVPAGSEYYLCCGCGHHSGPVSFALFRDLEWQLRQRDRRRSRSARAR